MAKVKNKRNNGLADKVHSKRKAEAFKKKVNPFEVHINREKIKVLGKKSKHDKGLPGVSRAKAVQKRKETLGTEMKLMNKTNTFIDRRIGEKNNQLSAEDRMVARFAAERVKQHSKKNIYNLADDEVLTHRGQTLEQIERFDDPRSDEEDEDGKRFGGLDDDFVSEGHFGGGMLTKTDSKDGAKSYKDLIEQLILESKKRKAEKQMEKEQTLDLTEKLDSEWKDLQPVVFKRQKVQEESLIDKVLSQAEKQNADYDKTMRELRFEKRGTPSDGLKSDEKQAKEERAKLEQWERELKQRMEGEEPTKTSKPTAIHRSAEDLEDNFELEDEKEFMLAYDKDGKPLVPDHILKDYSVPNAKPKFEDGVSDTSDDDDDDESSDEENKPKNDKSKRELVDDDSDDDADDSEDSKPVVKTSKNVNKDRSNLQNNDETSDSDDESDEDESEVKTSRNLEVNETKFTNVEKSSEDDDDDQVENDAPSSPKPEAKKANVEEIKHKNDNSIKVQNTKSKHVNETAKEESILFPNGDEDVSSDDGSNDDGEESDDSEDDNEKKDDFKDLRESDNDEDDKIALSEEHEMIKSFFDQKTIEGANLKELLSDKTPAEQSIALHKLIKKYDPGLSENNKEHLSRLFAHMLQLTNDIFSNITEEGRLLKAFLTFDRLAPYFYDLAKINKVSTKKYLIELLREKRNRYKKNPKKIPDLDTLIFFKLVSLMYPTSDFRHPVTTPCLIFMSEILTNSKFDTAFSISRGLFLTALILEYTVLSKRLVPSALNFLRGIIYLAANTSILNPIQVVPPFRTNRDKKVLLLDNDCSKMAVENKMAAKDLVTEINDEFKIRCLLIASRMTKEFFDRFSDLEAQECLFETHIKLLAMVDVDNYPKKVNKFVSEVIKDMKDSLEVKTYTPLSREKKRPKALRLYEPDIQDVFTGSKSSKLSREQADHQRLKTKYKKEMKGALREIRRDKAYVASVKIKQKIASDNIRKDKVKQIYKDASIQQGELNKLKRGK